MNLTFLLPFSRCCAPVLSRTVTTSRLVSRFACVAGFLFICLSVPASAFDFQDVAQRAKQLASESFKKPDVALPPELRALDYEHYHQIRYKKERTLWHDAKVPFNVDFFPPGWHFDLPFVNPEAWLATHLPNVVFVLLTVLVWSAKVFLFAGFQLLIRWSLPRFRSDQLLQLGWQRLLPLSIANVLVTAGWILHQQGGK